MRCHLPDPFLAVGYGQRFARAGRLRGEPGMDRRKAGECHGQKYLRAGDGAGSVRHQGGATELETGGDEGD